MRTRNGKIARLPRLLREDLNRRMDEEAAQARDLVEWLNTLDEVKTMLAAGFEGRPISEQNLYEWKQGGFREWQRQRQARDRVDRLFETSLDLDGENSAQNIPERLACVLATELAATTQQLLEETADPRERWQYLRQALRQLHLLRKASHAAARAQIEQARWDIECQRRASDREKHNSVEAEAREITMDIPRDAAMRNAFAAYCGGGETGLKVADILLDSEREYIASRSAATQPGEPDSPPPGKTQTPPTQA